MNLASPKVHIDRPPSRECQEPILGIRGISKKYGPHLALHPFHLELQPGEVHVLFGENGAGKSTLISILAGARTPSGGKLEIGEWSGQFMSVADARGRGIRAVFQEFSLIPTLTVAQNIVLGEEPVGGPGVLLARKAEAEVKALISRLGFELDPYALVASLPRGKQQMVEICKALRRTPKVLILDEPTASLSEHDAQSLFSLVHSLKKQGTTVIYITHRMHEIPLLADRVTVLRDGRQVATVGSDVSEQTLIELMTGRILSDIYPEPNNKLGPIRLNIHNVQLEPAMGSVTVRDVSLQVRAGEIVGVAGLVGCGKSELGQACFGLRRTAKGKIEVDGNPLKSNHPSDAIKQGLWYSPADRKADGLALEQSARQNISLSGLRWGSWRGPILKPIKENAALSSLANRVEFDSRRLREPVANFSGGNQQKVLLAKGLAQDIAVYVFDEPTVGVDVGARQSIYRCMAELSDKGAAILIISSDLPELMGLTHRMVVMNGGQIVNEFRRDEYEEKQILKSFF